MTRRFGRPRAGLFWLGIVIPLLGGASACGDDDGEAPSHGTGGATGGMKAETGGSSGSGGSKVSGGSSGAAPRGGSGGNSGGTPSIGGEGGVPLEGGGGAGPVAGSAGNASGASGGDAGSGTMAGSPNAGEGGAGQSGTGGRSNGGSGGTAGSDAGSGGGAEVPVEYRGCEKGAAITRFELFRIDRANDTCTVVLIQQGQVNCLDGLSSGGWCVVAAAISADVEACEAFQTPADLVEATSGEGTFTISPQPLAVDIDVDFEFPASGSLPGSVSVEASDCLADCVMNDCRP